MQELTPEQQLFAEEHQFAEIAKFLGIPDFWPCGPGLSWTVNSATGEILDERLLPLLPR